MAVAFHQFGFDFESANQNPRPSTNAELPSFQLPSLLLLGIVSIPSIGFCFFVCILLLKCWSWTSPTPRAGAAGGRWGVAPKGEPMIGR